MKHLIHKNHHRHLKKRAILEFIGLAILVAFVINQRSLLQDSFLTVLQVEVLWFLLLLGLYWFLLPLTAISYRIITPKPQRLKLFNTILAHLAGAGPGRIIPGGIGNLSISALHLKKSGLTIEQSIGVVITNNILGLFSNLFLLISVLLIRPETASALVDNISSQQLLIALAIFTTIVVLIQWLMHARSTKKEINKAARQWKIVFLNFMSHPSRVVSVFLIGITIALIHTFMLDLSGFALGVNVGIMDALIALSFGVIVGSIFPTPGGIGGVEAGITAALIVLGYDAALAASVAVLFRAATYWQPLIPGTLAYLYLREKQLI
jgi:glycosyltransferase 2 family protein